MKLIINNLKHISYEVEVPNDSVTIKDLKLEIEKTHGFDHKCIKLLFQGVVFNDEMSLKYYDIKEDNVIIMMNNKLKPEFVPKSQPEPQKVEIKVPLEEKKEEPKMEEMLIEISRLKEKSVPSQNDYAKELNSLIEMGFVKEWAETAIKASNGNIETAIEFLNNDIQYDSNTILKQKQSNDSLLQEAKQFAWIVRVLLSKYPDSLTNLMTNLQLKSPSLYRSIMENKAEFDKEIKKPVTDNDIKLFKVFEQNTGPSLGIEEEPIKEEKQTQEEQFKMTYTEKDRETIQRLINLGFKEEEVIQAYLACERNEDLTAHFLFNNLEQ